MAASEVNSSNDVDARRPAGTLIGPGPLLRLVKDERIAFGIVGVTNTAVGFAFFIVFLRVFGLHYMAALVLAYVGAIAVAFVLHRWLVFRVRGQVLLDLWRFALVNVGAFALNAALLPVAVEWIGLGPLVAQIVVTVVTVAVTYVGHRHFSFRRKRHPSDHPESG